MDLIINFQQQQQHMPVILQQLIDPSRVIYRQTRYVLVGIRVEWKNPN